jgi:hypothetical protein
MKISPEITINADYSSAMDTIRNLDKSRAETRANYYRNYPSYKSKSRNWLHIIRNKHISVSKSRISCELLNDEQKTILHLYFGISTSILDNVQTNPSINNNVKHLYYGKTKKQIKMQNSSSKYIKINDLESFFEGSKKNYIQIFEVDTVSEKNLILYFPTGIPVDDKETYYMKNQNTQKYIEQSVIKNINNYIENISNLILLLNFILIQLKYKKYSKIILSGHSNGMSAASFFSYILYILTLKQDEYTIIPEYHKINFFIKKITEQLLISNSKINIKTFISNFISIKETIQNKIFICGTAGFPCLFTNIDKFKLFNEFYQNKYIHIISGLNNNKYQIYDKIACSNELLYKNFGSIIFNISITDKKINCFNIEDILSTNFIDYDKEKTDIHAFNFYRYLYNKYFNRDTKNDDYFNTYETVTK